MREYMLVVRGWTSKVLLMYERAAWSRFDFLMSPWPVVLR
jgi:hypothetical protein